MSHNELINALTQAVSARRDSLKALRGRIIELLDPIPVGVILEDESGIVCRIVSLETGASQWGNRTWERTIRGWGAVSGGKLLAEDIDSSIWDGSNMHYRKDEGTVLAGHDSDDVLSWINGAETRALAARLPGAIASYMAKCQDEKVANDATLAQ